MTINVALAGAGAFGLKHLDAMKAIDRVQVVSLIGRDRAKTEDVARTYGIPRVATDLSETLRMKDVDAVILCTPTPMHAAQALACLRAGKHVQVEIPLSDTWADAESVLKKQQETGLVCMVGHTRRYNPSHDWVHRRIQAGEFSLQHLQAQTNFLRRSNLNALGADFQHTTADNVLNAHRGYQVAFLLEPPTIEQTAGISFDGGVMPQKSTDFYPKLLTGMAIYKLQQ